MTLRECYEQMGGNYEEVIDRLRTEERVLKYLGRFLADEGYEGLCAAMAGGDYRQAFLHVHNLKGVSLNLAFSRLYASAGELCEMLRGGEPNGDAAEALARVSADYARVAEAIRRYCAEHDA